jgi:hypothetical protein
MALRGSWSLDELFILIVVGGLVGLSLAWALLIQFGWVS